MTSDIPSPWLWVLRRAFDVPALVTDEHAKEAIVSDLAAKLSVARTSPDGQWDRRVTSALETCVDEFLLGAEAGDLDGCLVQLDVTADDARERVSSRIVNKSGEGGTKVAVDYLIGNVLAYVIDHPYDEP